jgi:hypothetical protein
VAHLLFPNGIPLKTQILSLSAETKSQVLFWFSERKNFIQLLL